jgi:hypothetical protein
MIKANELRLENWFYCVRSATNRQVTIPMLESISIWEKSGSEIPYKPIPLTPEIWNTVADFEDYDSGAVEPKTFDSGVIFVMDKEGHVCLVYDFCCGITQVDYVHQLQNLYFALSGEELDIKIA